MRKDSISARYALTIRTVDPSRQWWVASDEQDPGSDLRDEPFGLYPL